MSKRRIVLWSVLGTLFVVCAMGASWEVRSYLEDNPHKSGSKGQGVLFVRNDTLAALAGTDGDWSVGQVDSDGALYVNVDTIASITGTVTANAGTNLNTSLLALDASVDGLEGGIGAAADSVATQGGVGSLTAKLRLVTSQLNTIDADTGAIKTATEGAEDELDGTTTDGPLAKIAHTNVTLAFARIDDDNMTGGAYSGVLVAASGGNKIYVVELFLMVDAQSEIEWVEDPAGTPAILANAPPMFFPAYGGVHLKRDPGYRFVTTTVNKTLGLDEVANGTVGVRGYIWYYYAP